MNPADPSARSPCVGVPQRPVRPLSISPFPSPLGVSSSRPSLGVQTHIPFCSLTRAVGISPPTSPNPTVPPRPLPPPRPSSFLLTSGRPSTHSRGPNTQRRPRPPLRSLIPRQVLPDLSSKLPSPALRVLPWSRVAKHFHRLGLLQPNAVDWEARTAGVCSHGSGGWEVQGQGDGRFDS